MEELKKKTNGNRPGTSSYSKSEQTCRRRMDIQERSFQFAVGVVRLIDRLPNTIAGI